MHKVSPRNTTDLAPLPSNPSTPADGMSTGANRLPAGSNQTDSSGSYEENTNGMNMIGGDANTGNDGGEKEAGEKKRKVKSPKARNSGGNSGQSQSGSSQSQNGVTSPPSILSPTSAGSNIPGTLDISGGGRIEKRFSSDSSEAGQLGAALLAGAVGSFSDATALSRPSGISRDSGESLGIGGGNTLMTQNSLEDIRVGIQTLYTYMRTCTLRL